MMNGNANFDRRLTALENSKLGIPAHLAGFRAPTIIGGTKGQELDDAHVQLRFLAWSLLLDAAVYGQSARFPVLLLWPHAFGDRMPDHCPSDWRGSSFGMTGFRRLCPRIAIRLPSRTTNKWAPVLPDLSVGRQQHQQQPSEFGVISVGNGTGQRIKQD